MAAPQNVLESPVREGDVLAGKYRVERVLGVGGMGVVVAAMHTQLEERVALKFLLPSAARNPAVVARFHREARAAVKIKSPHVARVSDVGVLDDGTPYIVMEYLEGDDLGEILKHAGHLPVGTAVDFVLQAGEALAEAHAAGIVHRDLKPANLYLANQPDGGAIIKVLDFGISKALIADDAPAGRSALTGTADVFGSPLYMSPEQLRSSRDVDARADVWALGVILYEIVSGRSPFDRPTVAETFGAILHERAVPMRDLVPAVEVPEELDRIVLRCLEKDVGARIPNVAELARALFPFAATASRASLDRTSRVLERAGIMVESQLPLILEEPLAVSSHADPAAPAGTQTRTTWDTGSRVPRVGSRTTVVASVAAGALLSVLAGSFALLQLRRPVTMGETPIPPAQPVTMASTQIDRAAAAAPPASAIAPQSAPAASTAPPAPRAAAAAFAMGETPKPQALPVTMGETPKPQALPVVIEAPIDARGPTSPIDAPPSRRPPAVTAQPVTMGETPKPPAQPGRGGKLGATTAPAAAAAAVRPRRFPAKSADADDFGDRK